MIVRIYSVRSPSDAEALGCGEQGYYYVVTIYSVEGKPLDIRRVCKAISGYDVVEPELDLYLDVVGIRFSKGTAYIFAKLEEVLC